MKFSSFPHSGTLVNSRKLCFLLLFVFSLVTPTIANCDDNYCCSNADCEENFGIAKPYCNGGRVINCRCEKQGFRNRRNVGKCVSLLQNGMRAYGRSDYNSCAYKNGICGYCGPIAQDYRPCSKNSDCKSKFCDAKGHCRGKCKPRVKDGYEALQKGLSWDYNSCESTGRGHCGICGYGNDNGMPCGENKDCKSGWCNGKGLFNRVGCGGTCEAKRPDGEKASNGDYNSCEYGDGHCGYCGPPNTEGGICQTNGDCGDGLFCDDTEISLKDCTGICKPLIDDNKECPIHNNLEKLRGGNDSACKSGECMDFHQEVAYCRPEGGFLAPMPCTQDTDCSTAGHGYWCFNDGFQSIGQCAECPRYCENGCRAW